MGKTLLVLCLMLSLLSSCSDDKEQYVSFKQSLCLREWMGIRYSIFCQPHTDL